MRRCRAFPKRPGCCATRNGPRWSAAAFPRRAAQIRFSRARGAGGRRFRLGGRHHRRRPLLLFQQAVALAGALEAGDLAFYQAEHRRIGKRPEFMAELMLMLDGRGRLRRRVMRAFEGHPGLFARLLAMHVGDLSPFDSVTNGLALGWRMLSL